jgi:ankyrin repeat protein
MKTILGQTNRRQVLQALEKLPRGLSENLSFTMDRIKSQHAESDTKAQLALSVLMWLSTVKRPLNARELQQAVAVPPGGEEMDDLIDEMSFVDSCFGLVVIDPGTDIIRLVHFSVNEFLDARRHEFFPEADGTLALSCMSYILIQSPAFPTDGSDEVLDLFSIQQPFLEYASTYWGIHAATCFNLAVRCKVYELCQAQLASNMWTRVVQLKQKKMTSTDNKEWIAAAKYVAPGLSEVHLSAIYDIPDLGMDALKQKHRDINAPDSKMRTPLMIAAALGREELVELFLGDDNLDINAVDGDGPDGRPALWYAVESSNFAMVQKLCSSSHDIDINQGGSLATAVYSSGNPFNLEMIKFFLDHPRVDPNPYYEGKPHPTNTLARNFHITFLSQLIAMPDIDPWKWSSPLDDYQDHLNYITNTDYFGDNGSISAVPQGVRLLDSNPKFCYPDFQALDMMWPSVYFAYADTIPYKIDTDGSYQYQIGWMGIWDHTHGTWRTEVRERMESFGINFETTDSKGRAFVHSLARSGNVDFVRFLLDRGESVHRVDTSGRSPLHYAAEGEAEGCEETLQLLLDSGANPAAVDTNGLSVLHSACKRGNAKIVERLLGANADVNATDRQKRTPLHLASGLGNARLIISMLLDRGADIHARDFIGSTPLREATYCFESTDATLVLIERGANCDVISSCGPLITELLMARVEAKIWRLILPKAKLDGVELDSFGMTTLDVLSQPHAIDTEDERLPNLLLQYTETTSDIRATHVRANMLNRLDCMLASDDRTRLTLSYRTAFQLLILGDQDSTQTLLDLWPVPFSKSGKPYIQDVCVSCFTEIGPLFKCRTCPFVHLCKACHDKRPIENGEPKVPFCEGHEFLQFPSDNWKTLPEGVVNSKGDTLDEFLMSLKLKYFDSNPDTCVIL